MESNKYQFNSVDINFLKERLVQLRKNEQILQDDILDKINKLEQLTQDIELMEYMIMYQYNKQNGTARNI